MTPPSAQHPMPLVQYINRHAGETAWLFGKGPSLSTFDFKTAGPLRVAINDVIAHIPDCLYGFANDGVAKWRDVYHPHHTLFQPVRCMHEFDSRISGAVDCHVVTFLDDSEDRRLALPRAQLAEIIAIRRGTLGSALQILHVMGISTVHMVGIDGGCAHADGFQWRTRLRADHQRDYNTIRSAAIDAAHIMGITLKFHNQDHTMETNGRVFVRMIRNCFVQAEPYREGEIASFAPNVADEVISNRGAEPYSPPTQQLITPEPVIETAESRVMQAAENATVKTNKGKRR